MKSLFEDVPWWVSTGEAGMAEDAGGRAVTFPLRLSPLPLSCRRPGWGAVLGRGSHVRVAGPVLPQQLSGSSS